MLLSIVINNHNYGRYLAAAIDSALAQSYARTEVVVVDDGSKDDSRTIIEAYGPRIVAVFKENGGQASAVNAGFAHAHGDVIIFLDADDVLKPDIAAHIVESFSSRPALGKVQYCMDIIDGHGRPTGEIKPDRHLPRRSGDLRKHQLNAAFDIPFMSMSGNAFARQVLDQILPVPEQVYRLGADWYLTQLSPFYGDVLFLDVIGASYRVHGANQYISSQFDLDQVRQTIVFMQATLSYLEQVAERMGLLRARSMQGRVFSFSYVAMRMISYKLDPRCHPIAGDTAPGLVRRGTAALFHRVDVSGAVKVALFVWLVAMATAPRWLAVLIAEQMMLPSRRPRWINSVLQVTHRRHAGAPSHTGPGNSQMWARGLPDGDFSWFG